MPKKRDRLARIKDEFLQKKQASLENGVSQFERKLYNSIFDEFLKELEVSQGSINTTNRNLNLTSALDRIFTETQVEYRSLVESFGNDLVELGKYNRNYFDLVSDKTSAVSNKVNKSVYKIIGIDSSGDPVKGGFLDRFAKDTSVYVDIKDTVYKSISSGQSFTDLKTDLSDLIQGNEELSGAFQKHFRNYAYDTYQQVDRTYQEHYSEAIELTAFLFEGGIIETSRPFCEYCNGKVFTKNEFKKLTRDKVRSFIQYSGKGDPASGIPKTGWNPLIDLGGFGCRHSKNYISDFLAVELRDDLKIVNGKLIIQ
jgi:hypothetical protein